MGRCNRPRLIYRNARPNENSLITYYERVSYLQEYIQYLVGYTYNRKIQVFDGQKRDSTIRAAHLKQMKIQNCFLFQIMILFCDAFTERKYDLQL